MATTVVNRTKVRGGAPPVDVYLGRGDYRFGRWEESDGHNPFPVRSGATAEERAAVRVEQDDQRLPRVREAAGERPPGGASDRGP